MQGVDVANDAGVHTARCASGIHVPSSIVENKVAAIQYFAKVIHAMGPGAVYCENMSNSFGLVCACEAADQMIDTAITYEV